MLSGYLINGWKSDGKFEGTILHQSDCFSRRRSSINSKITLLDIQKGSYFDLCFKCAFTLSSLAERVYLLSPHIKS